jgi:amidase
VKRALNLMLLILGAPVVLAAQSHEIEGEWEVTTTYPGSSSVARIVLAREGDTYSGNGGWLIPDWAPFTYKGSREKDAVRLTISYGGARNLGELLVKQTRDTLRGSGTLHGVPITVVGKRPLQRPAKAPRVHDFDPKVFYRALSGSIPPVLRVFPGDTIRTRTVDAGGVDRDGKPLSPPGNPVTGPFYIEGAMPGDTLAVRFDRIRPNRTWAFQQRAVLNANALPPGQTQTATVPWNDRWTLDLEKGTATPDGVTGKLKGYSVKLAPMMGVVGVAPFWDQVSAPMDLGRWGGNLDYKEIREGTTVYFTVYQAGGPLFIGDGHALQGDGEITGQGLEISMDVEITVDVIRGRPYLDQPWAENAEYVMVSGIEGSLPAALQAATSGLSRWLAQNHGLNTSEITTLLANDLEYDIAEIVDPHTHVVAKIRKDVLKLLSRPGD